MGAGPLQQLTVVVQAAGLMSSTSGWDLQRIAQPEPLLMALVDLAQLAAQQMERTQAVDDLEHETQHQARRPAKPRPEEEADPGLFRVWVRALLSGHHHRVHHPQSPAAAQWSAISRAPCWGLADEADPDPRRPTSGRGRSGIPQERERLTTRIPSSSCQ